MFWGNQLDVIAMVLTTECSIPSQTSVISCKVYIAEVFFIYDNCAYRKTKMKESTTTVMKLLFCKILYT